MKKGNIKPKGNDIAFFVLPREVAHLPQHIFNEYAVAGGGIIDKHVCHRSHQLAVLNDRGARHECGQEGTTKFNRDLTVESINRLKLKQQVPFLKSFP